MKKTWRVKGLEKTRHVWIIEADSAEEAEALACEYGDDWPHWEETISLDVVIVTEEVRK